jgi:hypothetical protein
MRRQFHRCGLDSPACQAIVIAITEHLKGPLAEITHGDHVVIAFHANMLRAWPT